MYMLSQQALETILSIKEQTVLSPEDMAHSLTVTFFPQSLSVEVNDDTKRFADTLRLLFEEIGVTIVPFESSLQKTALLKTVRRALGILGNNIVHFFQIVLTKKSSRPYLNWNIAIKILRRKKVKAGITIISIGGTDESLLPIDYVSSFRKSSVITILDMPQTVTTGASFQEHFDTALTLFAQHMTNIVILVRGTQWLLYNFNASHPFYDSSGDFKHDVMHGLIPKVVAPIRPLRFSEFKIIKEGFDGSDNAYAPYIDDLTTNAGLLDETGLYPPGKKISDLPFRSDFYRWIGSIHLDGRSGMSYGFLARQLPTQLSPLIPFATAQRQHPNLSLDKDFFFSTNGLLYIIVELPDGKYCLHVPDVSIMSQKSGSNKTHINPKTDLVCLSLKDGVMYLQGPRGLKLPHDYRTSFDTGVIFAHAVGNAIIASIMRHMDSQHSYVQQIEHAGAAFMHWHGYLDKTLLPQDWSIYGIANPNVSCSSPQASLYAIQGKLEHFSHTVSKQPTHSVDVHIEPHHGTNLIHRSFKDIVEFLKANMGVATLGNKNLETHIRTPSTT